MQEAPPLVCRPLCEGAGARPPQWIEAFVAALVLWAQHSACRLQCVAKRLQRATMSESRAPASHQGHLRGAHQPRGESGGAPDGRRDHTAPRGRRFQRKRAATLGEISNGLFTFCSLVAVAMTAESAHPAGGQLLQVLPAPLDARDHPSNISIHPPHAGRRPVRPAPPRLSRDHLWLCAALCVCGWQRLAPPFSTVSTSSSTRLGGLVEPASAADPELLFRAADDQGAPRECPESVAGVCRRGGGGFCTGEARVRDPDGLW